MVFRPLYGHPDCFRYSKVESLKDGVPEMRSFDYLLIGSEDGKELVRRKTIYEDTHKVITETLGFHRLDFASVKKGRPVVDVVLARRVLLLKKE